MIFIHSALLQTVEFNNELFVDARETITRMPARAARKNQTKVTEHESDCGGNI